MENRNKKKELAKSSPVKVSDSANHVNRSVHYTNRLKECRIPAPDCNQDSNAHFETVNLPRFVIRQIQVESELASSLPPEEIIAVAQKSPLIPTIRETIGLPAPSLLKLKNLQLAPPSIPETELCKDNALSEYALAVIGFAVGLQPELFLDHCCDKIFTYFDGSKTRNVAGSDSRAYSDFSPIGTVDRLEQIGIFGVNVDSPLTIQLSRIEGVLQQIEPYALSVLMEPLFHYSDTNSYGQCCNSEAIPLVQNEGGIFSLASPFQNITPNSNDAKLALNAYRQVVHNQTFRVEFGSGDLLLFSPFDYLQTTDLNPTTWIQQAFYSLISGRGIHELTHAQKRQYQEVMLLPNC